MGEKRNANAAKFAYYKLVNLLKTYLTQKKNSVSDRPTENRKEMVIVLLRHFKQTQDFTSFPRQS